MTSLQPSLAGTAPPLNANKGVLKSKKIEIVDLDFYYGDLQALKQINLTIYDRSITAIIGGSGSGKTTLIRVLNRIYELHPDRRATGKVLIDGKDVLNKRENLLLLRRKVGMVFQKSTPFPMSIYDYVAFGMRSSERLSSSVVDSRVEEALRRASLWNEVKNRLRQNCATLSAGQHQRLCIAAALAKKSEILLFDGPTYDLDPVAELQIENLILELGSELCVVVVTQNLHQAARCSDFTAFLEDGMLVEFDQTEVIFTYPTRTRTEDYITGRQK